MEGEFSLEEKATLTSVWTALFRELDKQRVGIGLRSTKWSIVLQEMEALQERHPWLLSPEPPDTTP